jgi:leucyl aminopeptidase
MQYFTTTSAASRRAAGCIIVGVYNKATLGVAAAELDSASGGSLSRLAKNGDLSGRLGACQVLNAVTGVRAKRVLVVGLGKRKDFGIKQFRKAHESAIDSLKVRKVQDVVTYLTLEDVAATSPYYLARYAVESTGNRLYTYAETKSKRPPKPALREIGLAIASRGHAKQAMLGASHAVAIVEGTALARDLGNLPPNVCTPSYLARTAQKVAKKHSNLQTRVMNEAEIKKLGMHSFLSVTGGTVEPAKLIVMTYKGVTRQKPVVLVG